jgi:hypothetical protein
MTCTSPFRLVVPFALALACASGPDEPAREHLTSALSDTLGKVAEPSVGFLNNGKHLQVSLSSARFAESSDSTFAYQAREIAKFTVRHYEDATGLDSVTVLDRDRISSGVWKVHHRISFAVNELRSTR